jgi:hypothetical protein
MSLMVRLIRLLSATLCDMLPHALISHAQASGSWRFSKNFRSFSVSFTSVYPVDGLRVVRVFHNNIPKKTRQ